MNIKFVQSLLSKYDLQAKKCFGQNFLYDESILDKIITASKIDKNSNVIEIGPGLGFLTKKICEHAGKVISYEIDDDMINVVTNELSDYKNLQIIKNDFLKVNLKDDILKYFNSFDNLYIVANLPYYITTPILLKILEELPSFVSITCMVQKEVAERICGSVKTKEYNSLSVLMQYYTKPSIAVNVPASCFYPAPDVGSAVLHIEKLEKPLCEVKNVDFFLKFNRNIFALRRKTLLNNIKNCYPISKEEIENVLTSNNIKVTVRAEELSVTEICHLSDLFYEVIKK